MRTGSAADAFLPEGGNTAGVAGGEFSAFDEEHFDTQQDYAQEYDSDCENNGFHSPLSLRRCKYKQKYVFIFAEPILFRNLDVESGCF